ncbi:heat-inducible transcriptional repressor HrcA [Mycetocola zhadangensis]|uniref:heat-inducible transcriptional repressor HrcA n=1 Tax=Mycetocola zhadangensis TaxID=1164595 RepID=UPI003A4D4326
MVSERSLEVLRVIVQDYVASREPVGSKGIVDRHSFGVSAATIRNDMAQLEEEELISAPHTSSGRIPTDKGYRLFVDQLVEQRPLTPAQKDAIEKFLGQSVDLDDVLVRTVRLLSQITNQVAIVQYPSFARATVRHVEIVGLSDHRLLTVLITDTGRVEQRVVEVQGPIPQERLESVKARVNSVLVGLGVEEASGALGSLADGASPDDVALLERISVALSDQFAEYRHDKLIMAGAANLARTEDDFSGSIYPVLEALEQQVVLLRLFGELATDSHGVSASIGRENASFGLGETSIITSNYRSSAGELARLGVLGPTRMDYSNNLAAVRAVARYLSRQIGEN